MVEHVCCTCDEEHFTYAYTVMANGSHFIAFWLSILHILYHEAPYLIRTFILMLTVIILSFSNWRHGWSVFCACEEEHFTYAYTFTANGTYFIVFWPSILHTSSQKFQTCSVPLFDANSHNPELHWLVTWLKCVLCMWAWAFHVCICLWQQYTFYIFLALNSTHIISEAPAFNSTFNVMQIVIILSFTNWWYGSVHARKSIPTRNGALETCMFQHISCMFMYESYFLACNMHETLLPCMNHDWFMHTL